MGLKWVRKGLKGSELGQMECQWKYVFGMGKAGQAKCKHDCGPLRQRIKSCFNHFNLSRFVPGFNTTCKFLSNV